MGTFWFFRLYIAHVPCCRRACMALCAQSSCGDLTFTLLFDNDGGFCCTNRFSLKRYNCASFTNSYWKCSCHYGPIFIFNLCTIISQKHSTSHYPIQYSYEKNRG